MINLLYQVNQLSCPHKISAIEDPLPFFVAVDPVDEPGREIVFQKKFFGRQTG